MHNDHYETLLARAVTKGALQHEQIGEILNFRLFGNKRGYLTLENLPVGDIPPTPPSREQLNKPTRAANACCCRRRRCSASRSATCRSPMAASSTTSSAAGAVGRRTPTASTPSWICTPKTPSTPWYRTIWCCSACARPRRSGDLHRLHRAHPRASDLRRAGLLPHRAVQLPVRLRPHRQEPAHRHQPPPDHPLWRSDAPFFRFDPQFMLAFSSRASS